MQSSERTPSRGRPRRALRARRRAHDRVLREHPRLRGDRSRAARPDEIVFLSQIANDHHQVAFITGRDKPDPSNSVHHMAFRSAGTLDDLKALKKALEADPRSPRSCRSPTATPGRCTSPIRSSTASRCSSTRRGTCASRRAKPLDLTSRTTRSSRRRAPTSRGARVRRPSTSSTSRAPTHLADRATTE